MTGNILSVGLVLLLLYSANTPFERIVYAMLSLIYISINGFYSIHFLVTAEQALVQAKRFAHLSKLLKDPLDDLAEEIKTEEEALKTARKRFNVRLSFAFLIYLICLYQIVRTIFYKI